MVVVTVEQHDVDRCLAEGARRAQATEPRPHDEDRGSPRGPGLRTAHLPEGQRCGLGGSGDVAHLVGWSAPYCFCRTTTMRTPLKVFSPCRRAPATASGMSRRNRSEEHTSELQSLAYLVCRLLLEKNN